MATRHDQSAIRGRLEAERERLLASIAELDAEVMQPGGEESEHSQVGNHEADAATDILEQTQALSLAENERTLLTRVERALERLDDGQYGICEECGRPIPAERLEALPHATLCIACEERREQAEARQ